MSTYADAIRRQAEDAPRAALPAVTAALWRAYGEGQITEAEAEALSSLIELRQATAPRRGENAGSAGISSAEGMVISPIPPGTSPDRQRSPRTSVGSRPRSDASLERRRRWAASGRLPPTIAARFTLAEAAVLSLMAAETARRGDCRLAIEHMAAVAGVSRSTVKSAIREAKKLELLTVEERRLTGFRNDTNVVRIVSPEWTAWLRLARKGQPPRYPYDGDTFRSSVRGRGHHAPAFQGGGVKLATGTSTQVSNQGKTRTARRSQGRIA